jgi:hypothetical protein
MIVAETLDQKVDHILATADEQEAALLMVEEADSASKIGRDKAEKIRDLGVAWVGRVAVDEQFGSILGAFSTDEKRTRFIRATFNDSGYGVIMETLEETADQHLRGLVIGVFVEVVDDPGYIDEVLESPAIPLTDEQKLLLLEAKKKLG